MDVIPLGFKLGRRDWLVHSPQRLTAPGAYGRINYTLATLSVALNANGFPLTPRERGDTFWHEATHAILDDMVHPLRDNEPFVEAFSKRLSQVVHTARLP